MDINELKEEAKRTWVAPHQLSAIAGLILSERTNRQRDLNWCGGESIAKAFGFSGNIEAAPLLRAIETDNEDTIKAFILEVKELTKRMDKMRKRFSL